MKLRAIVLRGDGINCEVETADAVKESGFDVSVVHVNDLLDSKGAILKGVQFFVLPGGFSFGDELGSGKVLGLKLKHGLGESLQQFIDRGGAMMGICNGFQVMVQMGLFGEGIVLAQNRDGKFINRWVGLSIVGHSIFTDAFRKKNISRLELPVRHGEGRLTFLHTLQRNIVLQYEEDFNGSMDSGAALSAYGGRVMGLMPHPEAFWTEELNPWGSRRKVPLGIDFLKMHMNH